jgi:ATP/maltotriose-dependent transcriptional regulator MalT
MQNLGMVLARRGHFAEAAALQRDAAQRFEARKDPRLAGASRVHLALAQLARGDGESARTECERVLAGGFEPLHVGARAALSMVHLRAGDAAGALREARVAMAILDRLGSVEEFELTARLALAEALHAQGDQAGAIRTLVAARTRLGEEAARLGDENLRKSFLERVPEHARLIALTGGRP